MLHTIVTATGLMLSVRAGLLLQTAASFVIKFVKIFLFFGGGSIHVCILLALSGAILASTCAPEHNRCTECAVHHGVCRHWADCGVRVPGAGD